MKVITKCKDCGGTGEFYSFDGESNNKCLECEGKGEVKIPSLEELLKLAFSAGYSYRDDTSGHFESPCFERWIDETKPIIEL